MFRMQMDGARARYYNRTMRTIFHIDVNSAYLSWEAVRRRRDAAGAAGPNTEPDLRDIPSIIGGDPSRRTSIVLAKSVPAKKYGIK